MQAKQTELQAKLNEWKNLSRWIASMCDKGDVDDFGDIKICDNTPKNYIKEWEDGILTFLIPDQILEEEVDGYIQMLNDSLSCLREAQGEIQNKIAKGKEKEKKNGRDEESTKESSLSVSDVQTSLLKSLMSPFALSPNIDSIPPLSLPPPIASVEPVPFSLSQSFFKNTSSNSSQRERNSYNLSELCSCPYTQLPQEVKSYLESTQGIGGEVWDSSPDLRREFLSSMSESNLLAYR